MTPPKLIDSHDVRAQAHVLEDLNTRLAELPKLPLNPLQPWIFVAEGSSYNAVQWQLTPLLQAHLQHSVLLFYPWELEAYLAEGPARLHHANALTPYLIAVSQSGKTASLLRSIEKAKATWGHLEGLLLTNASPESLDVGAWQGLTPYFLHAGKEDAIAATKTFMATSFTLKALAKQALKQEDAFAHELAELAPEIRRVLNLLPEHSAWQAAVDLLKSDRDAAIAVIGAETVMPVLNEVHLKWTETLSRPVLTYHHEGFKHGPRSILHRKQSAWALLVYVPPVNNAPAFYADACFHLQHVDATHASRLKQLWIRSASTPPLPKALGELGHVVDLAVETTLPDDVLLLLVIQSLAVAVVDALGLEADGLTKFVAEPL
jgi:glucosamine 6-phosphate synthetase-like amidotransferase/phosphosugar isomerase protein